MGSVKLQKICEGGCGGVRGYGLAGVGVPERGKTEARPVESVPQLVTDERLQLRTVSGHDTE
jgi:hypothetical protein